MPLLTLLTGGGVASTAPTRIQTTPQVRATASNTVAVTFSSQPVVGNAIVVPVILYNSPGTGTISAVDNQGNTYSIALFQFNGQIASSVLYCSKITTTGTPFTVTVTFTSPSTSYFEACAIEVNNVGIGLTVDKTKGTTSTGTILNTGNTTALTNSDVFAVTAVAVAVNLATITVDSVSPSWTQELENLSYSASVAGEADSRTLTGVSGTTQSSGWTLNTSGSYSAIIVVFAPGAATSARLSQLPVEVGILSNAPISARLSQLPVEILVAPTLNYARISQLPVEAAILSNAPITVKLSQLPVEVLVTPTVVVTAAETTQFFVILP